MLVSDLEARLLAATRRAAEGKAVRVCFSGGVDSTLVLAASLRAGLPARALLAVSPSLPRAERAEAHRLAAELGAELEELETRETELEGYRANAGDRCYHCKSSLYGVAEALAAARGEDAVLLNGTQLDDLGDVRPGLKAAR